MSDNPKISGESKSRFDPTSLNQIPPTSLQYHFPRNQHPPQSSSSHHHPHLRQLLNYGSPMSLPPPIPTTSNVMKIPPVGYQNNIVLTQSIQQQVTVDKWAPKKSLVPPVRVQIPPPPPPVQIRSVVETLPQAHSSQSGATQPPPPFPRSPIEENLGAVVPVPDSIINNSMDNQEQEEETGGLSIDDLNAKKINLLEALDKLYSITIKFLENGLENSKKLNESEKELTAAKVALSAQLQQKERELGYVRCENGEIKKKAENDVRQEQTEKAFWRNNFVLLRNHLRAIKRNLEEKDKNIHGLEEKVQENEIMINELNAKLLNFEMLESKLKEKEKAVESLNKEVTQGNSKIKECENKFYCLELSEWSLKADLENKDKNIKKLEKKYETKCKEFSELEGNFDKLNTVNIELETRVNDLVKKDKADEVEMQKLKAYFKLRFDELKKTISEKEKKINKIEQELEKNREKYKVDIEEKDKLLKDSKEKVKAFENGEKARFKQMNKLQAERDKLALTTGKQKKTISQIIRSKSKEIQDLNNKIRSLAVENQDLEKTKCQNILKTVRIKELEEKVKSLEKEKVKFRKDVYNTVVGQLRASFFPENSPKQKSSSSTAVNGDKGSTGNSACNEASQSEKREDTQVAANRKRKYSTSHSSTGKKQCQDVNNTNDHKRPINKLIIRLPKCAQIDSNKTSDTKGDTEASESSSSSSSSESSSDTDHE